MKRPVVEESLSSDAQTDVAVWYLSTSSLDGDAVEALSHRLSGEERDRRDRFRFADDRRDFTAAHALLRHALSRHGTQRPEEWRFAASPTGKPFLANGELRFNLSHTRGLVGCVVACGLEVGVDVEAIAPLAELRAFAEQYCSPEERDWLNTTARAEYSARSLELWTLKEACAKAIGDGLTSRFDRLSFALPGSRDITFAGDIDGPPFQFALAAPTPSHRLAVALRLDDGVRAHLVLQEAEITGGRVQLVSRDWLRRSAYSSR